MMVAGRTGAQAGAQGRRILFFTENAQGWNALWPIVMRLKQHADLTSSRLAVTYLATKIMNRGASRLKNRKYFSANSMFRLMISKCRRGMYS